MSLHQDPTQTAVRRQKRSLWTDAWRRMRRSHTAVIGMILFALIVIVCFSAPLFSDYDAQVINSDIALIRKYPVEGHPLGTDELGRDLLLRILWGGRTSITIALAATVVSSVLGIILGAIPAYYGGATDSIIMRTLDVFMAIPSMLLMITLVNIMKPTTFNLIIACPSAVCQASRALCAARCFRSCAMNTLRLCAAWARLACASWSSMCCPTPSVR